MSLKIECNMVPKSFNGNNIYYESIVVFQRSSISYINKCSKLDETD